MVLFTDEDNKEGSAGVPLPRGQLLAADKLIKLLHGAYSGRVLPYRSIKTRMNQNLAD